MQIDQFLSLNEIALATMQDNIPSINNRYKDVTLEIVQISHLIKVLTEKFINIIFFFRKDDIVDSLFPCKVICNTFIVRYGYNLEYDLIPLD